MNMKNKKLLFIYNPKAGKGKIRNHLFDIIDIFSRAGYEVTACPTNKRGDAIDTIVAVSESTYSLVVCCGGDGTLKEVITGMMARDNKLPIGYIPAGSTNDFANSVGIPANMLAAAEHITEGEYFPCDVGKFNQDVFVYIAAFGAFTEVSYETDQMQKNVLGHMAYILQGAKSISSLKSYQMKIITGETVIEDEFIFGMITNSTSVGGFKDITGKDVHLDDGEFEVTLVRRPMNALELNDIIVSLISKKMDSEHIYCLKASHLEIEADEVVNWTLDGEFGGCHRRVIIHNEPKAVTMKASNDMNL